MTKDQFLAQLDTSGECWTWRGKVMASGHGYAVHEGKTWTAGRLGYVLQVGPVPSLDLVRQRCGNRRCARPEHLYVVARREVPYRDCPNCGRMAGELARLRKELGRAAKW